MKAYHIRPETQTVEEIEWHGYADLKAAVEGLICSAWQYEGGDTLYVNDEGLLNGTPHYFLWTDRGWPPLAGNAILVGPEPREYVMEAVDYDGPSNLPPRLTLDEVRAKVRFLTLDEVRKWATKHADEPLGTVTSIDGNGNLTTEVTARTRDLYPTEE